MNNTIPPNVLDIELEERDIRADLAKVVESMEAMRREQLADSGEINDEKKNEYLHLTYRLSSGIEGLADSGLIERMQFVVEALDKNKALLNYDRLQDGLWKEVEPEFMQRLDQVVIFLQGDDFLDLSGKHHVLNALKYLGSKNDQLEKRVKIYDTCLPFSPIESTQSREVFRRELKKRGVSFESSEGSCLEIKKVKNLDSLLTQIANLGFTKLRTVLTADNYRRLSKEIDRPNPNKIKSFYLWKGSGNGTDVRSLEEMAEVLSGMDYHDERFRFHAVNRNRNDFSIWISNEYSDKNLAEQLSKLTDPRQMAESIHKRLPHHEEVKERQKKILLEKGYNELQVIKRLPQTKIKRFLRIFPYTSRLGEDLFLVEFRLVNQQNTPRVVVNKNNKRTNYHPLLEKLATHQLEDNVENNLIWNIKNHHTFGKCFAEAMKNTRIDLNSFARKEYFAKESSAWAFYDDCFESEGYYKAQSLICFQGQRYVVTQIGTKSGEINLSNLCKVLSLNKPTTSKIEDALELENVGYIHLSRFERGIKLEDYTATN